MEIPTTLRKEARRTPSFDWADVLIAAALSLLFYPTFHRLAVLGWPSADYTHAYFLVPISAWLFFRQRKHLQKTESIPAVGIILFAAALLLTVFSALNRFMFLEAFSFVLMVWALFRIRFTGESLRPLRFPLAYLLFLVPPPQLAVDLATLPLKKISTAGSYFLLKIVGLPVEVRGAILKVGEYELFVSDACSGFRSMVALLALGALYAYFAQTSRAKQWVLFAAVVPLGILGNILRIFLTGCISYFFGVQYAEGFFHEFSGGLLFLFTLLGLMMIKEKICGR